MAVGNSELPEIHLVKGIRLATAQAGVKYPKRDDLVLIELTEQTTTAGVYTQNQFCAAPVLVAKDHEQQASPRYLLINTGNANAGTGEQGIANAKACCQAVADATGVDINSVLPFSTGVIGETLPVDSIVNKIEELQARLTIDGWTRAAGGIMTTDTRPKVSSRQLMLGDKIVTVTGIAKGSGMIKPNMATMLAYIATDATIENNLLQQMLKQAVDQSFNRITVDGDTSTNDACMLMATGTSGYIVNENDQGFIALQDALAAVFIELAQGLIRDGEGAAKFVTVNVKNGSNVDECLQVAYTIAESPLVKTALFACDPNWGRLLAAIGRAGVSGLDVNSVDVYLGDVLIAQNGCRAPSYTEEAGQAVMDKEEIAVTVNLNRGDISETVWTTDLSYDYVRINAEYRS